MGINLWKKILCFLWGHEYADLRRTKKVYGVTHYYRLCLKCNQMYDQWTEDENET